MRRLSRKVGGQALPGLAVQDRWCDSKGRLMASADGGPAEMEFRFLLRRSLSCGVAMGW
jgi:hypothetical protein